jgi:hypothetical protein
VPSFCLGRHQSIHLGRSGRDDQPRAVEVGGLIRFLNERHAGRSDSVAYLRRDDDEIGAGGMERRELRCGNRPTANHHDAPPLQLQKRGKQADDRTPSAEKQKSPEVFLPPGLRLRLAAVCAVQDINAATEGREALRAAYSSNNYTRRSSQQTFSQL